MSTRKMIISVLVLLLVTTLAGVLHWNGLPVLWKRFFRVRNRSD